MLCDMCAKMEGCYRHKEMIEYMKAHPNTIIGSCEDYIRRNRMNIPEEMNKLRKILDDMGIEWQDMSTTLIMDDLVKNLTPIDLSMIRTHFSYNGVRISVICGHNSYGGNEGLLEMWNGQDEPEGYLTAEDIIKILKGERE